MSVKTVVMKFGGSSVADADKIKNAARRILAKRKKGARVVVVVSAPGDTTDDLITLAEKITDSPPEREMDMLLATGEQVSIALLSMAIHAQGQDAVSLTGPQAGIFADADHTRARITKITPEDSAELSRGRVVIVAGFQGLNPMGYYYFGAAVQFNGCGAAASPKADACEIYTDVKAFIPRTRAWCRRGQLARISTTKCWKWQAQVRR